MQEIRDGIIAHMHEMTNLPVHGSIASDLLKLLHSGNQDDLTARALSSYIERDIGLSAKVLKIANSVVYTGRYGQVGDVKQAIARLGLEEISRICLAVVAMQVFPQTSELIDLREFWKHSTSVASVTRSLQSRTSEFADGSGVSGFAYTAGLFHDIGILALESFFRDIYREVRLAGGVLENELYELENNLLGLNHGEVGAILLEMWHFPEDIVKAIMYHHSPDMCPDFFRPLCQMLHVSDFACSTFGIPEPGGRQFPNSSYGAWFDLHIDLEDLRPFVDEVEECITQSGMFVSIAL